MKARSDVNARFTFSPEGSQSLVVLSGLMCGLMAIACIAALFLGQATVAVASALFSLMFGAGAAVGWWTSRVSSDLKNAVPTTITTPALTVSTDSRALAEPKLLAALGKAIQMVAQREPLPEPSGLVNASGTPDPSKVAEAKEQVAKINEENQRLASQAISAMTSAVATRAIIQPRIDRAGLETTLDGVGSQVTNAATPSGAPAVQEVSSLADLESRAK